MIQCGFGVLESLAFDRSGDFPVPQGLAILEITGLGPALVTLDTIEKTAPVEILHYELNDLYGICVRLTGAPAALESAGGGQSPGRADARSVRQYDH